MTTTRERIEIISREHGWLPTKFCGTYMLQIERGDELLSIQILPDDGGLGSILLGDADTHTSRRLTSGLPGLLAVIRKPAA